MNRILLLSLLPLIAANPFFLTTLCGYSCPYNIRNAAVHASGQSFWLGLPGPATYCPQPPVVCAAFPGNETLLASGFEGQLSMWDVVPGGQRVFVAPDGTIGFTQAHSAFVPPGSYLAGFTNMTTTPNCHPPSATILGWSTPDDRSLTGIIACIAPAGGAIRAGQYKLYARTPGFNKTGCVELVGLMVHEKPTSAFNTWQYT